MKALSVSISKNEKSFSFFYLIPDNEKLYYWRSKRKSAKI